MRLSLLLTCSFLASFACSRGFKPVAPPSGAADALRAEPALVSAAPHELLQLGAAGGTPPYHFAFAAGSPLSGSDATLGANDGAYRAGSNPLAQDVITVTDANGATANARITVGPQLALLPLETSTAPRGQIAFSASGGKPPYVFSIDGAAQIGAAGAYSAGDEGLRTDLVIVTDATGTSVQATVRVGAALSLLTTGARNVAPTESLDFVAFGGEAPYVFSIATNGSGASIDARSGRYTAGIMGSVTDTVLVTDSHGATASLDLSIGPALSATLLATTVRPTIENAVIASGGKPPYRFRFRARGNRSDGSINVITGAYVPGENAAVTDWLEVLDATSAPAALIEARVGEWSLPIGFGTRCMSGDLDGDGYADMLVGSLSGVTSVPHLKTARFSPSTGRPTIDDYATTSAELHDLRTIDVNGDGKDDLLLLSSTGVQVMLADASGRFGSPIFLHSTAFFGGAPGFKPVFAVAQNVFSTQVFVSFRSLITNNINTCSNFDNTKEAGIVRIDWLLGKNTPETPVCVRQYDMPGGPTLVALTAANFDGLGGVDLAWIESDTLSVLRASYAANSFATVSNINLPSAYFSGLLAEFGNNSLLAINTSTNAASDLVFATSSFFDSRPVWWIDNASGPLLTCPANCPAQPCPAYCTDTSQATPWYQSFVPMRAHPSSSTQVLGVSAIAPYVRRYAHNGSPLSLGDIAVPEATTAECAATPDVNRDGLADLVVSSRAVPSAQLLFGNGDGSFGGRPRFFGARPQLTAFADLDGDGYEDAVAVTDDPNLRVLHGGDTHFSYTSDAPLGVRPNAIASGDFGSGRGDSLVFDADQTLRRFPASGPVAVVVDTATSLPVKLNAQPRNVGAANFGGAASGDDIYGIDTYHQFFAVMRTAAFTATKLGIAPPPLTTDKCAAVVVDLNDDAEALDDVALVCRATSDNTVRVFSSVTARNGLGTPQMSAFAAVGASLAASTTDAAVRVLSIGRDQDRAFFAIPGSSGATDSRLLSVTHVAGMPIKSTVTLPYVVRSGQVGRLGLDAHADLALVDSKSILHILDGDGAGNFVERAQTSCVGGDVAAIGSLKTVGVNDIILQTPTELVPWLNDGTGGFPAGCP